MSSPVPHTQECGTDETSDSSQNGRAVDAATRPTLPAATTSSNGLPEQPDLLSNVSDVVARQSDEKITTPTSIPMTAEQLAHYAKTAGVPYPTTNGADLYRMGTVIPKARRDSFESSLGDAVGAYYDEITRQGHEPPEPAPDPVESFVRPGLLSGEELFDGYRRAQEAGQTTTFLTTLKERNEKAAALLLAWIKGDRGNTTVYVPRSV